MKKSAEEFIREKSFPSGIADDKWEEFKITHQGINWVGFAITAMEEYNKQEMIAFKKWYDKLPPSEKVSLWSESGEAQGLFNLSDERIVENWNRYQEPKHTKFADDGNECIINAVVN